MTNSILNSGEVGNIGIKHLSEQRQVIASKWEQFGLLEGLKGAMKENVAQLFENQANYMLNESTMADQSGSFETVAFPVIRRTFAKLLANELVSIQALSQPVGRLYFINPKVSTRTKSTQMVWDGTKMVSADVLGHRPMEGSFSNGAGEYILDEDGRKVYDTALDGSGKPFHRGFNEDDSKVEQRFTARALYDMYYATEYNDEGDALFNTTSGKILVKSPSITLTGEIGKTPKMSVIVTGFTHNNGKLQGPVGVPADTEEFLSSLKFTCSHDLIINTINGAGETVEYTEATIPAITPLNFRVLAQRYAEAIVDKNGNMRVELDLTGSDADGNYVPYGVKEGVELSAVTINATYFVYSDLEGDAEIAEVSFDFDHVTVDVGEPKKLRASFTPEVQQDVQVFQNIDVEAELASLLSETVSAEIDREILRDLRRGAAWADRWDYRGYDKKILNQGIVGLTRKDYNQELITKINQISAMINKSTLRGGANWIVVSPEVSAVFNDLEYFHVTNAGPEETKYSLGIEKVGSLQNRLQVYVDVYSPPATILIGHKGDGIFHAGYIYAPYVPLMLFPKMTNPSDFRTVMGIMTRYAKKMVNNRFFGKITVDNLPHVNVKEFLG
jgi:hypothetical protein